MPSEVMKVGVQVREKTKEMRRPKTVKEKEDEEMFNKLLDSCRGLLSNALKNGGDIYQLLDPLISDTQCHMHALLLLSILNKCTKNDQPFEDGIEMLEDKDKSILSHGILLSLLKTRKRDKFGLIVHEIAICHFNGSILSSKKRERHCVTKARKNFNSFSVEFTKIIAENKISEIFGACKAASPNLGLKFLPCYASVYAVINYMEEKKLPIIISLVNINTQYVGEDTNYTRNSNEVIFYEYREYEKKFVPKTDLTDSELKLPTIAFSCYRLINNIKEYQFPKDSDIKNLLMMSCAGHIQLPSNSELPEGYEDVENYARDLYKKNETFYKRYIEDYELAKIQNLIEARYSRIVRTSEESEAEETSFTLERRKEDIFFGMDHIYLSNYSRECYLTNSLSVVSNKLDKNEDFKLNMNKLASEASKKITETHCKIHKESRPPDIKARHIHHVGRKRMLPN